jgi:NADH-ubiquinone oxidoreductase chain 5
MTFLTTPNAPKSDYEHTHEQPLIVMIPLIILALMSIFFGYVAKDSFVGMGSDMLATSLFVHPSHITLVEAEFAVPTFYKLLPAVLTLFGSSLALLMYHAFSHITINLALSKSGKKLYTFFNAKWFFDAVVNYYIIGKSLSVGNTTAKVLDRGAIELLGPFGLTNTLYKSSTVFT